MSSKKWILFVIVVAEFCGISLWFAGNGVMDDLLTNFNLKDSALAHMTSAVQFGFITGTLIYALLTIADRFSPSKVFLINALLGALFNAGIVLEGNTFISLLTLRFLTGFFLAGIYPVGMKIAADYFDKGLGKSLGLLVGALVVGTALPHLLKDLTYSLPWRIVILTTSGLAVFGGLMMFLLIPDGPYRKAGKQLNFRVFFKIFQNNEFRSAAFGYFGHMWELYALWAFVPVILKSYAILHPNTNFDIPLLSFFVIAIGGFSCTLGGYISLKLGTKKVAFVALLLSCICCLVSPLILIINIEILFIGFLLFWGMVVVADSPLFSTLVAHNSSPEVRGTALTIVNSIGFLITIFSIQLISGLHEMYYSTSIYAVLAIGPVLGLIALMKGNKMRTEGQNTI